MSIQIYNTLTRRKEPFIPLDPQRVTLYACGPTVYNYAHIGNARPAVIFDLVRQVLARRYSEVIYARNITDVDDKINQTAAELGVPIADVSKRYTEAYHQDMDALGVKPPTIEPRATDHISEIIKMIEQLLASDNAYEAEQHVLFDIENFPDYGALSRRDRREMIAGARVDVAPYKKSPGDFVLWKPSSGDQPGWDSPWGRGRPGWHIECSAMSAAHLGNVIDIHGGGQDLVFPHHENEVAQSRCAHGTEVFARYWMHNGFVTAEKRKMSKSLGNTMTAHELLKRWPGEALRYVLLSAHYRQPLDWSDTVVEQAVTTLDRLYGLLRDHPSDVSAAPDAAMIEALEDDINTPTALAALNGLAKRLAKANDIDKPHLAAQLRASGAVLNLLQQDPEQWFAQRQADSTLDDHAIEAMIRQRDQARSDRDFAEADRIRDELAAHDIVIKDGPEGTRWEVATR